MSVEKNKAVIRRIYEEIFKKGNMALIDEVITPNYISHAPGGQEYKGREGFKQFITQTRNAMPDLDIKIEHIIAEGDKVAHCGKMTGTFTGEVMGIAPTGKKVTIIVTTISRFENGKEAEAWMVYDQLSMYQQMAAPLPSQ